MEMEMSGRRRDGEKRRRGGGGHHGWGEYTISTPGAQTSGIKGSPCKSPCRAPHGPQSREMTCIHSYIISRDKRNAVPGLCTKQTKRGARKRVFLSSRVKRKHLSRHVSHHRLSSFICSEAATITPQFCTNIYPRFYSPSCQPLSHHRDHPINTPRCTCGNAVSLPFTTLQLDCSRLPRWT